MALTLSLYALLHGTLTTFQFRCLPFQLLLSAPDIISTRFVGCRLWGRRLSSGCWQDGWLRCLANTQVVYCKTDTISPTWYIFSSPGRTPGAIATKMWKAVFRTDLHSCAKFQPHPFGSFGGNASWTDRHKDRQTETDRQTTNLIPSATTGEITVSTASYSVRHLTSLVQLIS